MAKPIELVLTLEDEDAKIFWENMENPPKISDDELNFYKDAIKLYHDHPFLK